MIVCWAVKGGSGTTVVACALALGVADLRSALLVDLAGDCATALGLPEPLGPGVADWLASSMAKPADLLRLAVPVRDALQLIPRGSGALADASWPQLVEALGSADAVVVDCGTGPPPPQLHEAAQQSLLVTRPCFLALRRAQQSTVRPSGVVLVREPGRALGASDVEHALGVPVVAEVHLDPAVARAVDAGLLAARLPRSLLLSLRNAA